MVAMRFDDSYFVASRANAIGGMPTYRVNATLNALAERRTNINVNVVCPGYVAADLNDHRGIRTLEEGARQR